MEEKKVITLPSRYENVHNALEVIEENRGLFMTDGAYTRTLLSPNSESIQRDGNIEGIDFEGGPVIMVGDTIDGHTIKSIKCVFLAEFEQL